jgi:endonuclease/exonuclease/phosphatase (EEP) superfamily protein YafD
MSGTGPVTDRPQIPSRWCTPFRQSRRESSRWLNATRDIREFRRLLRDGYRDAAEQAGAGLTRTHPADIWLPPLLAIDHILTRGCAATAVRTLDIKDSDHRALVADIQLPN